MEFVADLHLHSKYSRAVSRDMNLQTMALWAQKKGLNILSTGDWTHPLWFREIKQTLVEDADGLFKIKSQKLDPKSPSFLLSVEISSIYSQGGKVRRIHNLVFSPSFAICERISAELIKRGANLNADGRPIIGLSAEALADLVFTISEQAMIIPCHAWTPWFSLYGSNSGFDSIDECFGKFAKYIYAVETGLSSDPYMNWQIKELDNRSILSFSDAHSPAKMGREATVFMPNKDLKIINYSDLRAAIMGDNNSKLRIGYTIEFYPEEGKYHFTGHRNCAYVQTPDQTRELGTTCPKCGKSLTIGVMHRVEDLANKKFDDELIKFNNNKIKWNLDPKKIHPPFIKLVSLNEIIAESLNSTVISIKVKEQYEKLVTKFGSELNILLKVDLESLKQETSERVAEGVEKVRNGDIDILPGFDGQYGIVKIWKDVLSTKESNITSQLGIDF